MGTGLESAEVNKDEFLKLPSGDVYHCAVAVQEYIAELKEELAIANDSLTAAYLAGAASKNDEIRELRKDVERYRWLRGQNSMLKKDAFMVLHSDFECDHCESTWVGSDLDAAIDAASAASPGLPG